MADFKYVVSTAFYISSLIFFKYSNDTPNNGYISLSINYTMLLKIQKN